MTHQFPIQSIAQVIGWPLIGDVEEAISSHYLYTNMIQSISTRSQCQQFTIY
jgi:hypothetical protein